MMKFLFHIFDRVTVWVAAPALALSLALAGCSGDIAGPPRQFISVGTAPPGGAFFVVGGAIGETLQEAGADYGWNVTAEATMGSQENIRRLVAGELDLALSNSSITYFAVRGQGEWDRPYEVRAVMTLAPNVGVFVTPADSGVRTLSDFRNRRIFVGPAGAGFEYFLKPLLAEHGVSFEEFTPVQGTQAAAVDMLADRSAAAAFLGGATPTAAIAQASAGQDIFFIPLDSEASSKLADAYPFFNPAVIPAGTYRGQTEDFHTLDVGSMHLIAAADEDADLVYRVTRALYENRQRVEQKHAAGRFINEANVVRDTGTEFHPGAIRYYREIGIWPDKENRGESAP